ncbi:hypothetical protein A2U01_0017193, partial [Trifolium medium]|nr:hypothetical protein [Trifolium medium]
YERKRGAASGDANAGTNGG